MSPAAKLTPFTLPLTVDGTQLTISGLYRDGSRTPLVFLHGFGSTKEDYADVIQQPGLAEHAVLAYDAPGCGATTCSDLDAVSVPFLVSVAQKVLAERGVDRCHLIGHSMGGLTALLLADAEPERVASFVDIEGNLAPEDCFLSRQVLTHGHHDPDKFLDEFTERVSRSRFAGSALYGASLPRKVRVGAVAPIFRSMVQLSDHGALLDRFLALPAPTMLMYGEQNNTLSYLQQLAGAGAELAEIDRSGHFPMYTNPTRMWDRITGFVSEAEADHPRRTFGGNTEGELGT